MTECGNVERDGRLMIVTINRPELRNALHPSANEEAVTGSYEAARRLFSSADIKEGPQAFAEKRKPQWKGR
ncbi:MAG: hypothetical protein OXT09_13955 [Myxococcales bacterium]|nr:hypothetical protein [Myxococcales bacterium]